MSQRVALVTGAGSATGIGFAVARALAGAGLAVAVCSTTERIHDRARDLELEGAQAAGFEGDLTDAATAHSVVEAARTRFGPIDVLVNNAGMVTVSDPEVEEPSFVELPAADWERSLARNLSTAFHVTQSALPDMRSRGWGRVVMVSSVTGPLVTNPRSAGYSAAKAGMDGLMRAIASRWRAPASP